MPAKYLFKFDVLYFKNSGKWGYEGKFELECSNIAKDGNPPCCYMQDVVDHLRNLRNTNQPMPGISGPWAGFITVTCPDAGYPCLILPEWADQARPRI